MQVISSYIRCSIIYHYIHTLNHMQFVDYCMYFILHSYIMFMPYIPALRSCHTFKVYHKCVIHDDGSVKTALLCYKVRNTVLDYYSLVISCFIARLKWYSDGGCLSTSSKEFQNFNPLYATFSGRGRSYTLGVLMSHGRLMYQLSVWFSGGF